MINKVIIEGRLTSDSTLKKLPSGSQVLTFRIANNVYNRDNEVTNYIDVELFGDRCEKLVNYLTKGKKVLADGKLKEDRWTDKDDNKRSKYIIVAYDIQFLEPLPKNDAEENGQDEEEISVIKEKIPF